MSDGIDFDQPSPGVPYKSSLRIRYLVSLVTAAAVAALLTAAVAWWVAGWLAVNRAQSQLQTIAGTLSVTNFPLNKSVLDTVQGLAGVEIVTLDLQGERQASTIAQSQEMKLDSAWLQSSQKFSSGNENLFPLRKINVGNAPHLAMIFRRSTLGGPDSNLVIVLLYPESRIQSVRSQAAILPIATGILSAFLLAGVSIWITTRQIERFSRLERQVAQIAAGRLEPLVEGGDKASQTDDEIAHLQLSLNQMVVDLRDAQARLQQTERMNVLHQMTAGLLHQLRNTLTGAQLALQLHAQDCPLEVSPDTASGSDLEPSDLSVAQRQIKIGYGYLDRLSRIGSGRAQASTPAHFRDVCEEVLVLIESQAKHLQTELRWNLEVPRSWIASNGDSLRDSLLNLALNALTAAGEGGGVFANWREEVGKLIVIIEDTGPGPPDALSNTIFEPFVTSKPEGLGLGLSVVQSAMRQLGGDVRWCRQASRTQFILSFPKHGDQIGKNLI